MADRIKITPEELLAQATEMKTLEADFSALFSGVTSILKEVNTNWSPNLSHNFASKITCAQKSFAQITQELLNGAKAADTCAVTYQSIDTELAKMYSTDTKSLQQAAGTLWEMIKEEIAGIPEDIQTAGEALGWIEDQLGKLPKWVTSGAETIWDIFVPDKLDNLKDAYNITSDLLQGEFTWKEGWEAVTDILKGNPKLAVICETINYTFETGLERSEEMDQEIMAQLAEGDVLGAVVDGLEGFTDTIIGGTVEVLGNVGGGLLDSTINDIPVIKGINKLFEYGTGLAGWNEGEGYSVGGLIGAGTEKLSEGIDKLTDIASDAADTVTDAVTEGFKDGVNWVKSWFD